MAFKLRKLLDPTNYPRYALRAPNYISGVAKAKTMWGGEMYFPFPEFECIKNSGIIDHSGEIALAAYMIDNLGPGDIFFDIGANAGYFSVLARYLGAEANAFEPMPWTFRILKANALLHGFYAWNVAVAEIADGMWMKKDRRGSGWSSVDPKGTIRVTGMALDEFPIAPTFIKLDVERFQMPILRGAEKTLAAYKPTIMIELERGNEYPTPITECPEKDFLFALGYTKMELIGHAFSANYLFT